MSYEEVTTTHQTEDWRPGQNKVTEYDCATSTGPQYLSPDPEPEETLWDQTVMVWAKVAK